jgi:RNA polymerase primary sigma factor
VWWIRQTIHQALAENSRLVRLPVNKINAMHKISQVTSRLEQEFGREPTNEEISQITKMTEEDIRLSMQNYARTVSMDAPLNNEDEDGSLYDITKDDEALSPEDELLKESLRVEITRTLSTIPTREADVLKYYLGLTHGNHGGEKGGQPPLLIEEIARRLQISPERVRQIKDKAIRRLRHNSRSKILKTYLG